MDSLYRCIALRKAGLKLTPSNILLGLSIATALIVLACVPIYTDELVWHSLVARLFDDGRVIVIKTPQCSSVKEVTIPWILVPGRFLFSLIYYKISPPYLLRLVGICVFSCALLMGHRALIGLRNETDRESPQNNSVGVSLLLLGFALGLSPVMWILARPEGIFLLSLISSIWLGVIFSRHRTRILGLASVIFGALCCLSAHPKSLFFTPVFLALVVAVRTHKWSAALKTISCALILSSVAATVSFYHKIYDCPDAPFAKYVLSTHMINPASALQDPSAYTAGIVNNFLSVSRFAHALVPPKESVFWGWLPPHDLGSMDTAWQSSIIFGFWVLLTLIVVGLLSAAYYRHRLPLILGSALFLSELALLGHQSIAHHYDGAFHLGMLSVTAALLWQPIRIALGKASSAVHFGILILICGNLALLVSTYGPIVESFDKFAIQGAYPQPFHSGIQLFNYGEAREKLWDLSKLCDLDLRTINGVVVDDLSYPYAQRAQRALHTMGMDWFGADITDQLKLLQDLKMEGVLARCKTLRPDVVRISKKLGELCCVNLKKVPSSSSDSITAAEGSK